MALRSAQNVSVSGAAITMSAVAASDVFVPGSRSFYAVNNAGGGSINATVVVPGVIYGVANPDIVVAVGAGELKWIGPLVPTLADPTTGLITINHSGTTSVTGAHVALP